MISEIVIFILAIVVVDRAWSYYALRATEKVRAEWRKRASASLLILNYPQTIA